MNNSRTSKKVLPESLAQAFSAWSPPQAEREGRAERARRRAGDVCEREEAFLSCANNSQ